MSLLFLCLKASHVWDTPYDSVIAMGLVQGDLLVLSSWLRVWWYCRGR